MSAPAAPDDQRQPGTIDAAESAAVAALGPCVEPEALRGAAATAEGSNADAPARIKAGRLAGLSLGASIWVISWPILAESFLNWAVGAVDTIAAARVSEAAADAVAGASYVAWFLAMFGMALGVGSTAVVSRSVGKGRLAVANAAVGQSILLAAALGVIVGALVFALSPVLGSLLGLTQEGMREFNVYMRVLSISAPAMVILEAGVACCRGAGDSFRPLRIMIVINLINMLFTWALSGIDITRSVVDASGQRGVVTVLENPFPFRLGVLGIALGTAAAWVVGAAMILRLLHSGDSGVTLLRRRLAPHWHTMRRVVRIGLPNFLETLGMWAGNFIVIMIVGALAHPGFLGAHIVAIRIEALSFLPGFAMSLAAATLMGQWLGAGDPRTAGRATLLCSLIASVFMGLMGLVFLFFPDTVVGLFTTQPAHLETTPRLLQIAGAVQIPFAVGMVLRSALRAAGDAKVVMWITWVMTWAVRLPLAFLLTGYDMTLLGVHLHNPAPFGELGLVGLWYGLCAEVFLRGVAFSVRYAGGAWRTMNV